MRFSLIGATVRGDNGSVSAAGELFGSRRQYRLERSLPPQTVKTRSDEELYRLMKKGDREAFGELYERRGPALRRYALHMSGSPEAAEEVAHEVFIQLMRANTNFDDSRGSLEGWMYGVARNLVRVIRRKGPVEEPVDQAVRHDILGGLINEESLSMLRVALRELPELYRDAVVLCDLEEKSYEEAARAMGCPVGTVRSRLHRARGLLGAKLKRQVSATEMAVR
jgi:RNA polymerase sigma-70 factor (ECF subfamily)